MLDTIAALAAALYSAFTAFALTAQAVAPLLPWQASVALSGLAAAVGALAGWVFARLMRRS